MSEPVLLARSQAAPLLARGMSTDAVGEAVGVTGRTVRRWMEEPAFAADVHGARRLILAEAVAALTYAVRKAVETLHEALDDDSAMIRVRAASELIRSLPALSEHADLEARIAALEAAQIPAEVTRAA